MNRLLCMLILCIPLNICAAKTDEKEISAAKRQKTSPIEDPPQQFVYLPLAKPVTLPPIPVPPLPSVTDHSNGAISPRIMHQILISQEIQIRQLIASQQQLVRDHQLLTNAVVQQLASKSTAAQLPASSPSPRAEPAAKIDIEHVEKQLRKEIDTLKSTMSTHKKDTKSLLEKHAEKQDARYKELAALVGEHTDLLRAHRTVIDAHDDRLKEHARRLDESSFQAGIINHNL